MSMFCYQCQETACGTGCEKVGVCGKKEDTAKLQDLLVYVVKGVAHIVVKSGKDIADLKTLPHEMMNSLFITITNANFDDDAIEAQIVKMIGLRDELRADCSLSECHDAAVFQAKGRVQMLEKASGIGVLSEANEDIRSLRELVIYGIKGMAAYAEHARNLNEQDNEMYRFACKALNAVLDDSLGADELLSLVMETGAFGVKAMAMLDKANTEHFGNPEISQVNLGVGTHPGILVSGHDLHDLEMLLEQTVAAGVDIYTHSEMLPAHAYPALKKYPHLVGNYGGAWWNQTQDFASFRGPILFTTNCIVPPKSEEIRSRIFTTGSSGYPGCKHIEADAHGKKDFSSLIQMAKTLPLPQTLENGSLTTGFAHHQVLALADQVAAAVKSGAVKKFVVMAGCDGRMKSREYYTEFAKKLPKDTIILTAGCAKYRYNKLDLGTIDGIPRILDAGQCNDSYSLAVIALKLKELFGLEDVNDLPIVYNIAWYEQKAVIVLLALLSLGVKNIHLGPTLPGFLSPNTARILAEKFGITPVGSVDDDIKFFFPEMAC